MTRSIGRLAFAALSAAVFVIGFGSAAILDSSLPAVVGCAGLFGALLAVGRLPRGRDG